MLSRDFSESLRSYGFWYYTALLVLQLRYRSTVLGPLWIVAETALYVPLLGLLYTQVLAGTDEQYFAHLAIGLVMWTFISTCLQSASDLFVSNRNMILSGRTRLTDYILQMIASNLLLAAHHLVVIVLIFIFTVSHVASTAPVALLTLPLVLILTILLSVFLATVGSRFRDVSRIIRAFLRVAFFATPIVWSPVAHGHNRVIQSFIYANPFYYMIESVRAPLIYGRIPWLEIAAMVVMIIISGIATHAVYKRGRAYVAVWI